MPEMSRVSVNLRTDLTPQSAHAAAVAAAAEAIAADAAADVAAEAATTAKAAVEVALLAAAKAASKAKHVAVQAASAAAAAAASTVGQSSAPDQPTLGLPPPGHADAVGAESAAVAVATAQAAAAAAALAVAKIAVAEADAATAAAANAIEAATLVEAQLRSSSVAATVALASAIARTAAPGSNPWPAALDARGNNASALKCAQSWSSTLVEQGRGLAIAGELDICTAPMLASVFSTRPADYYADGSFLLDLTELSFVDVRGMRQLADIDAAVTGAGHQLRVAPAVSTFVARVLRIAVVRGWLPRYFLGPADAGNSPASAAAVALSAEY